MSVNLDISSQPSLGLDLCNSLFHKRSHIGLADQIVFMKRVSAEFLEMAKSSNVSEEGAMSPEQIQKSYTEFQQTSTFQFVIRDVRNKLLVGSLISIIVSIILRK